MVSPRGSRYPLCNPNPVSPVSRLKLCHSLALLCLSGTLSLSALGFAAPALSAGRAADPHAHEHHAAEPAAVPAERWRTDAPLRQSMEGIRDLLAPLHGSAELTAQQASAIAEGVTGHVQYMITHCDLAPEADAALHTLIGDMLQGASKLSDQRTARAGIEQIDSALGRYPSYFEHPGWNVEHIHQH